MYTLSLHENDVSAFPKSHYMQESRNLLVQDAPLKPVFLGVLSDVPFVSWVETITNIKLLSLLYYCLLLQKFNLSFKSHIKLKPAWSYHCFNLWSIVILSCWLYMADSNHSLCNILMVCIIFQVLWSCSAKPTCSDSTTRQKQPNSGRRER